MRHLLAAAALAWAAPATAKPKDAHSSFPPTLMIQTGHSLPVEAVALSRDGAYLATGGRDGEAILWDAKAGHKLRSVRADALGVSAIALSPDGKRLLAGGAGMAGLYDMESGRELRRFGRAGEFLLFVGLTPEGGALAVGPGEAHLWDIESGRRVWHYEPPVGRLSAAALSADGKTLALSAGNEIVVVDLKGQKMVGLPSESVWTALAFSRDGTRIASGNADSAAVWSLPARTKLHEFKAAAGRALVFMPDGKSLTSCGTGNTARVWTLDGEPLHSLIGHLDAVRALALSADGRSVATGSDDRWARVWESATGRAIRAFGGAALKARWAFISLDGSRLLTVDDQSARLWDAATGRPVRISTADFSDAARFDASADARWLAWQRETETVELRDLETGMPALNDAMPIRAQAIALDPDGRFLLASHDGRLRGWDLSEGKERGAGRDLGRPVRALWIGLGGRRVAALDGLGQIGLWDLDGFKPVASLRPEGVQRPTVAVSRDGLSLALGAALGRSRYLTIVRAMGDGAELKRWRSDQELPPLAFSAGGQSIWSAEPTGLWEWEIATGRKLRAVELPHEARPLWDRAIDPAGRTVLCERAGAVSVVSLATGKERGKLLFSEKGWIVLGADGRVDAAPEAARWTVGLRSRPLESLTAPSIVPGLLAQLLTER